MRLGILTGGGDVPPLNVVINTIKNQIKNTNHELIGFIYGWQGLLQKSFVKLNDYPDFSGIGGTILKSSRINLVIVENGAEKANEILKELKIDGLIIIGGDDTLSNAYHIDQCPCVLISKTIDNDVGDMNQGENDLNLDSITNYFTLGYPTAANKIISYSSLEYGLRTTAYSHERIIILESMGMHAGWLALASGLGSPDFIIIPEFPLNYERFCHKLITIYEQQKNAIVVIAEGAKFDDGTIINADYNEMDDFGHPQFGGSSYALKKKLKKDLKKYFNTRNINAVNPSYLYRAGAPNNIDKNISEKLGKTAFHLLVNEKITNSTFLTIQQKKGLFEPKPIPLSFFPKTENSRFPKRYVDFRFYNADELNISQAGIKYVSKIAEQKYLDDLNFNKKEYSINNFKF